MSKPNPQVEILFVEEGNSKPNARNVRSHIVKVARRRKQALSKAGLSVLPLGSKTILVQESTSDMKLPPEYDGEGAKEWLQARRAAQNALSLSLMQDPNTVLPAKLDPIVLKIMHPIWSGPVAKSERLKLCRKYGHGHYEEERELMMQNSIPMRIDAFENLGHLSLGWQRSKGGYLLPNLDARRRLYFHEHALRLDVLRDIHKELATPERNPSRLEVTLFTVYKFIPKRTNHENLDVVLVHTNGFRALFFTRDDPWTFSDRRIQRQLLFREMTQNDACWSLISSPTDFDARVDKFLEQLLKRIHDYATSDIRRQGQTSFLHPESFLYRFLAKPLSQESTLSDTSAENTINLLTLLLLSIKSTGYSSDIRREYLIFIQSEIHRLKLLMEEDQLSLYWIVFMCSKPVRFDDQHQEWQAVRFMDILKCTPPAVKQTIRDILLDFLSGCTRACANSFSLAELRAQMVGKGARCKYCGSCQDFPGAHQHTTAPCIVCQTLIDSGETRSAEDLRRELQRELGTANPRLMSAW